MSGDDIQSRVAKLEAWQAGHHDQCKERFELLRQDIKLGFDELKVQDDKLHGRISEMDKRFRGRYIGAIFAVMTVLIAALGFFVAPFFQG